MSHCLNPDCPRPTSNPPTAKFCSSCGSKLLLKDRYRAIKPIGQGGFSRTFLAVDEDKPSKPRCVIKQFFPLSQGTNNAQKAAELFEREAVRLDELGKHPQIPELLAYFTQDNRQYLVQEFIDGQNLEQELADEGPFNESKIRQLLQDLLPVLQFVHEKQVIHRDIKPDNIIRRRADGQLVLVDFGAAKVITPTALFATATRIGAPEFVAPEQARGQPVFASDLYSLAVTCIHLLTQVRPFDLFDVNENTWIWRQYLINNPVSGTIGQILDKMLQRLTKQRYQSAKEVLQDLPPLFENWKCLLTLTGHSGWVNSVAFSPDGQTLASGSQDKTIIIWDLVAGKMLRTLGNRFLGLEVGHTASVSSVIFSRDSKTLISGGNDKTIKIWNVSAGTFFRPLTEHSNWVTSLAMSADGQILASGSLDKTAQVCYLGGWQLLRQPAKFVAPYAVDSVAIAPDGQTLAAGIVHNGIIQLWSVGTGKLLNTLSGHSGGVFSVAFSPNGQILASGGYDKTIKLWDWKTGKLIYTLSGHSNHVFSVAFSPDGQILASGSKDSTVKLWNTSTGDLRCNLWEHSDSVTSVAFSPDGKTLATGSWDKTIKIWRRD